MFCHKDSISVYCGYCCQSKCMLQSIIILTATSADRLPTSFLPHVWISELPCLLVNWPAQDVDTICIVLQRCELGSEDLQGLQDLPVLEILQILLLQQQELHPLYTKNRRGWVQKQKQRIWVSTLSVGCVSCNISPCLGNGWLLTLWLSALGMDRVDSRKYFSCTVIIRKKK